MEDGRKGWRTIAIPFGLTGSNAHKHGACMVWLGRAVMWGACRTNLPLATVMVSGNYHLSFNTNRDAELQMTVFQKVCLQVRLCGDEGATCVWGVAARPTPRNLSICCTIAGITAAIHGRMPRCNGRPAPGSQW